MEIASLPSVARNDGSNVDDVHPRAPSALIIEVGMQGRMPTTRSNPYIFLNSPITLPAMAKPGVFRSTTIGPYSGLAGSKRIR